MTQIGNFVITGALFGYILVTAAIGFSSGSNMAGFAGLIFGVPVGIVAGVIASAIWSSKEPRSGAFVLWSVVAGVMVIPSCASSYYVPKLATWSCWVIRKKN